MRDPFRFRGPISFRPSEGGGPPEFTIAPSILSQPLIGQAVPLDAGEVTGEDTTSYQWYRGDPGGAGVAISGADTASYTPVMADYGLTLWRRTTATNAAGSTISDAQAPAIVGAVFTEDFAAFTAGDATATVLAAGWTRGGAGAQWQAAIVADAGGPSGKALDWSTAAADEYYGYRTDMRAFGQAQSVGRMQALYLVKHTGNTARFAVKIVDASALTTAAAIGSGQSIRLDATYHQLPGQAANDAVGTATGSLVANSYYWIRHEVQGDTSRVRRWLFGSAEPAAWDSVRVHTGDMLQGAPALLARTTGAAKRCCFLSAGYDADAPYWPGYIPPAEQFTDLQTFAAATSQASISRFGGDVVINLEDV